MYGQEGADRSGGHWMKRRAWTGEEGDVRHEGADRSGGPCMVKRALTCQEGAERRGRCTATRTLYSGAIQEGTNRSGGRYAVRKAL